MVHTIKKFKPMKFTGFDFEDDEWQDILIYPESKVVIIKPSHMGEEEEIREFDKIEDGVE